MPRDSDGLGSAVKAILDRLIELRRIPIPNDGPDHLEVVCQWVKVAHFAQQKTVIEIWDISNQHT